MDRRADPLTGGRPPEPAPPAPLPAAAAGLALAAAQALPARLRRRLEADPALATDSSGDLWASAPGHENAGFDGSRG